MIGVVLSGCLALTATTPASPDRLRLQATVAGGVDTNAEQTSTPTDVAGAMQVDLEVDYIHPVRSRTFIVLETASQVRMFHAQPSASRARLQASLSQRTFLLGAGRVRGAGPRTRQFPQIRLDTSIDYGLAVRIDSQPLEPTSPWSRTAQGGDLVPTVDDDRLDIDGDLAGPALAFLRPLHDLRLRTGLRWAPHRRTWLALEPAFRRVLQAAEPLDPVRHYIQTEIGVRGRQRLWRGARLEGSYRFERRDHDERLDRQDDRLVLNTHRTEAALRFRWGGTIVRFSHAFRFREASGGGTRTRRHTVRAEAQQRLGGGWALVLDSAGIFQARLDRTDRDWSRLRTSLGLRLRY